MNQIQKHDPSRMLLLRTKETATRYEEALKTAPKNDECRLCSDLSTIKEFKYWRIVPNAFPYDRFFAISEMLVSKRHTDENGLSEEEIAEWRELKNTVLSDNYDHIFENLPKQKSIPHHIHYHLVTPIAPE